MGLGLGLGLALDSERRESWYWPKLVMALTLEAAA